MGCVDGNLRDHVPCPRRSHGSEKVVPRSHLAGDAASDHRGRLPTLRESVTRIPRSPGRAIRRVTVAGRRYERCPAADRPPGWGATDDDEPVNVGSCQPPTQLAWGRAVQRPTRSMVSPVAGSFDVGAQRSRREPAVATVRTQNVSRFTGAAPSSLWPRAHPPTYGIGGPGLRSRAIPPWDHSPTPPRKPSRRTVLVTAGNGASQWRPPFAIVNQCEPGRST